MRRFLTFDDVGLIPKFNHIASRLHTNITTRLGIDHYKSPIIPANMDSVICRNMANICRERGAPIIFHRFSPIDEQVSWIKEYPEAYASLGLQQLEHFNTLYNAGCTRFCIDIAHGHSQQVLDIIREIKQRDSSIQIIAGNVCTAEAVRDLSIAGADIVKVGVGPGAACITRMMTGFGVPQFSAIQDCVKMKKILKNEENIDIYLIADGGIKNPRDAVIALAAGADAVMMGSIFARTFESAAKKTEKNGKIFGRYRGQASSEFMNEFYGEKKKRQPEGVAFDVEITKSANDIFDLYEGGLRSALTYAGVEELRNFKNNVEIFESSSNYLIESNFRHN